MRSFATLHGVRTTGAPKTLSEGAGGVLGAVAFACVVGMSELVLRRRSVEQRRQRWPVAGRCPITSSISK